MISCSVCAQPNDDLETICASCGSFIQDRIPNLDFFWTAWQLVESPREAFKRIVRAEHKNYVLVFMMFLGIGVSFSLLWARHAGNEFDNLIYLILLGYVLGLGIGLPVGLLVTYLLHGVLKILGSGGTFKNTYAVVGWSLLPILISVLLVLPIEFGAIGLRLFSTNPSPMETKPFVYLVLLTLDGLAIAWSIRLATVGIRVAHKVSAARAFEAVFIVVACVCFVLYKAFAMLII